MPLAYPAPLAPYATRADRTRGRLHEETESPTRTPFQRDRDRVIHAVAFRRLKHKTQVFVAHEGDHYRTRLTHSLEVSQIARSLCRRLRLDEDLGEVVALAHDLGHPPFGHTGEDALDEAMAPYDGFDHNAQTLRVLTKLERPKGDYEGLNLTWETLEGTVKHNGPLIGPLAARADEETPLPALPAVLEEYAKGHDLELHTYAGLEAQIAALADDIAYNNHDSQDGLRAGLFTFAEALDVPLLGERLYWARQRWPDAPEGTQVAEAVSSLIGIMVNDVFSETSRRLTELAPQSAEAIREADAPFVRFSEELSPSIRKLRSFLFDRLYRHYLVNRARSHAKRVVRDLFHLFFEEPNVLPPAWFALQEGKPAAKRARVVCDYIAGMTDSFALEEHRRLFTTTRWL
ncbi:deoxyguanosinetriphosphate triphosphohydrolase, putative [Parvularcula bermudensis HTCC2503]|uniref:Deoxyguanosinetriphosphate triphosphohydrolase-like protein n=1 Tax=Parvularcula bermudensis (strain ATCC BAA-594 / HTCC2503 / KCTC 12087) TaxID=314260 RepID=E0TEB3_PARBH|nr:deoxyguanosinetriphosphate triphosphohydrolase [Parvularcula bermudensis]ADM09488.1 deoxyguanosinetriphosphate triphosphohydrolase, putative [Parvularcula bermudensis HTCC2503]